MGKMKRNPAAVADKIMDLLVDMVCVVDAEGHYVYVNSACEELLGYTADDLMGRNMIEFVHPDDREKTMAAAMAVMGGQPHVNFENRYIHRDGSIIEVMWSARWSEEDQVRICVARDVTEPNRVARRQEAIYRISDAVQSDEGLAGLYKSVHKFLSRLLPVNRFCMALYDSNRKKLVFPYFYDDGERFQEPVPLREGCMLEKVLRYKKSVLANTGESSCPVTEPPTGRDGYDWLGAPLVSSYGVKGALVVQVTSGPFSYCEEDLDLLQFVAKQVGSAIDRKRQEARLHHMAHHDPLTNLPNRTLFLDRMRMALRQAKRSGERITLLYLDLCNFKSVNDSLGHAVGDEVLRQIGGRIRSSVRESDTVCRIGGDEFTVLLNNLHGEDDLHALVEKISDSIAVPIELQGKLFRFMVDMGIAIYPDHGDSGDQLLRYADSDMYKAKRKRLNLAEEHELQGRMA